MIRAVVVLRVALTAMAAATTTVFGLSVLSEDLFSPLLFCPLVLCKPNAAVGWIDFFRSDCLKSQELFREK